MRAERAGPTSFTVELESEQELRDEYAASISSGGVRLLVGDKLALFSSLTVTLRLAGGGEAGFKATVVGQLPGGYALALEGSTATLIETLTAAPRDSAAAPDQGTVWDRLRALTHLEKLMLAPKADRAERAILLQDGDSQVLNALLKNPRLTVDEVIRLAKSPHITYQTAEVILKSNVWFANLEVRVALIHNAKTPQPMALRILPTLPESELKTISRGAATSQALKQGALRRLQSGS